MEIKIDVYDIATEEEIKEAALDAVRRLVFSQFSGKEENLNRLLVNLSYDFVFEMVNRQYNGKLDELLKNKIGEVIQNLTSFTVFKKKDFYEKEDSVAYKILQEEMAASRPLIRKRIDEIIDNYPFSNIGREEVCEAVYQCVWDRLFGETEATDER